MKPLMELGEIYSERKLSELIEFATRDLQPGPGYQLRLEGVKPTALTHKELEAFFGATFDETQGASLDLIYNQDIEQMVLRELSFPLKGLDGRAQLLRTDTIGYIPVIEMRGNPFKSRSAYMSYDDGQRVLEGFGIPEIPSYDPLAYMHWRAGVLSKTQGWHLIERLEVPLAVSQNSVQTSTLINEETVTPDLLHVSQRRSLTRSIVLFDDTNSSTSHIDYTVESEEAALCMYKQTYQKSMHEYALNFEEVTDSKLVPIGLNENSYHDFSNALLEVIHVRNNDVEGLH